MAKAALILKLKVIKKTLFTLTELNQLYLNENFKLTNNEKNIGTFIQEADDSES